MKNLIIAATVLAISVTGALAATPHEASGRIDRINAPKMRVTVNHHVYRYGPGVLDAAFKRGDAVKIWYNLGHGHRVATKIVARGA